MTEGAERPFQPVPSDDPRHGGAVFGLPAPWYGVVLYTVCKWALRLSAGVCLRMRRRHASRVPDGAVILAPAGHRSNIDTPLIGAIAPRRLNYMAKSSLFKSPFWTKFLTLVGGFPTERDRVDRRALRCAREVLRRGEALVIFPEGERKSGPRVQPLFDGPVWLSIMTGAPIQPVGIGGSERAMPKGARLPRFRKVRFVFGEPIPPPAPAAGRRTVSAAQRAEASARLRKTLQQLFDEAQAWAGSLDPPRPSAED
ncbi:MAG: lysophospholipid acyltransferase family protein [bacterium]|nr:lysophospholipid acyltransferase family protein [bacterium]MCY3924713.1 lysophospholipid acyltransferase family protein [bacterium]